MTIERSSGNVFRDLGFGSREAESLRLRAELMRIEAVDPGAEIDAAVGSQASWGYPTTRE
jgi:hypothetical protein